MSRNVRISSSSALSGGLRVPGDKSISHRIAMLAAIAEGASAITNFASSADCHATLDCVERLGIRVERRHEAIRIYGNGLHGFDPSELPAKLFVGNSGSTIRMISGILAGQSFTSELDGDESIRRRPMKRIIEPLRMMGAQIDGRDGNFAPLKIRGGKLRAIRYESPVASAQVKSCLLFAGLFADGTTVVKEPAPSRNHSELMLHEMGAAIEVNAATNTVSITGGNELRAMNYDVAGDLSGAAFFLAAATLVPDSHLRIEQVSLNPSRTAFLDVLGRVGGRITTENVTTKHGEPVGDLLVENAALHGSNLILSGSIIPNLIDEIPILAIVGTQCEGRLEVRDAGELRIKESDRIKTVAAGIRAMGGEIEEFEDGFAVSGKQKLKGVRIETAGDHRIAMAFSIAGLIAEGETEIIGADCAAVSFPEFYDLLSAVSGGAVMES